MKSLKYATHHTMSLGHIQSRKLPIFQYTYVRLLIKNFEKGRCFQINRRGRLKTSITTKHENGNIKTDCHVIPYDIFIDLNATRVLNQRKEEIEQI